MKIIDIKTKLFKASLKRPFVTALRRVDFLEDVVVMIECDDGFIGYGEGASTPIITGETIGSIISAIAYIKPFIIGRDIEEFEDIISIIHRVIIKNTTAKSALEIALYDLKAQSVKLPLYQMLGGSKREFKTDITISMGEIDCMIVDSLDAISLGYDTLKIKLGDDFQKDIERVVAIKESIGSDIKLRLDANQGWTPENTVYFLHKLESRGIVAEFIEQPIRADDIDGFLYIKKRVQTPLLADESIFSLEDARIFLDLRAIDYLNMKLAKTAGITDAMKLADLAKEYGVKCMIGCMLEGPVSISAGLALLSAKADVISMVDLDGVALLSLPFINSSHIFDESQLILSNNIGLDCSF
ncbi:MAG: dipeptide epimerase [Sulfurovum sp.]